MPEDSRVQIRLPVQLNPHLTQAALLRLVAALQHPSLHQVRRPARGVRLHANHRPPRPKLFLPRLTRRPFCGATTRRKTQSGTRSPRTTAQYLAMPNRFPTTLFMVNRQAPLLRTLTHLPPLSLHLRTSPRRLLHLGLHLNILSCLRRRGYGAIMRRKTLVQCNSSLGSPPRLLPMRTPYHQPSTTHDSAHLDRRPRLQVHLHRSRHLPRSHCPHMKRRRCYGGSTQTRTGAQLRLQVEPPHRPPARRR